MKILIGWCLVSMIGTLVALRLIRNGKNHQPDQLDETRCGDQNQSAIAPPPTPLQESNIAHHSTEHLR